MDPPTKTNNNTWSALLRYNSKPNCLSDYRPPKVQGTHKPVNTLKLPPNTHPVPSSKKAPSALHEKQLLQEHLKAWQEPDAESLSIKSSSRVVIDLDKTDNLPDLKSVPRPVQSASRRNSGANMAAGLEEFRRVERQTNFSTGLSLKIPDRAALHRRDTSPKRIHAALSLCSDSEDSNLKTDTKETTPTFQNPHRTYPQVVVYESRDRLSSSYATPRSKRVGSPSFVRSNGRRQDGRPTNDSQSDHSAMSMRDRNEQVIPSSESKRPLKRKTRHSVDTLDISEDELAPTYKLPKIPTQSRPQKNQALVSDIGNPWKTSKLDTNTKKYRVLSIFSETYYWIRPEPLHHWHLHQNLASGVLAAYDEQGDPIHELILKPRAIQKIQRNLDSEKLVVHKHKDAAAKGSTKIFLELVTADDARQICDVLKERDSTIGLVVLEGAQLDKKFLYNRRLVDSKQPKAPQLLVNSGTRAVTAQSRQTPGTQGQGRERKSVEQRGATMDRHHTNEHKDGHSSVVLGKRKRHEDANPLGKKRPLRAPRNLRSSNILNNDGSDIPAEACQSIDPDSFYGNRDRLSPSSLDDREPVVRQPSSQRSLSPLRWTEANQNWAQAWKGPIVYPRQGDKKSRTTVELNDVERLDDGQYLNDNIINFYLSWLEHRLGEKSPELAKRIYFHNTFFYKTLTQGAKGKRGINYEAVERWTSKSDLLSFDYIIVPINEHTHWYVTIICNAARLQTLQPEGIPAPQPREDRDRSGDLQDPVHKDRLSDPGSWSSPTTVTTLLDKMTFGQKANQAEGKGQREEEPKASFELKGRVQGSKYNSLPTKKGAGKSQALRKFDPLQPRIITLDSLGLKHSPTCTNLKNYLISEIRAKKKVDIPAPRSLGVTAVNIPQQTNYVDCGLFLLNYVEQFLKHPDKFIHDILQTRDLEIELPTASFMRNHIRQILFDLQEDQGDEAEVSIGERSNNKQVEKTGIGLDRSQMTPVDGQIGAVVDRPHSNGRISPKHQGQDAIEQSPASLPATCRQPNGTEGTPVFDVDFDEVSRMEPVSSCENNHVDTFLVEEKHREKPGSFSLGRRSSSNSMEALDTTENGHGSSATLPARDATTFQGRQFSSLTVEGGEKLLQDASESESTSQVDAGDRI
ncbi:cysteine proteinase [Cadophora sp. DSE1049]|nr:cysteine proteinase [Cadophora sp. DSE1049]